MSDELKATTDKFAREVETKLLAKAIAAELNELYLSVQGDDYRELVIQSNINGVAVGELEKQLKQAKIDNDVLFARNVELVGIVERLVEMGDKLCIEVTDTNRLAAWYAISDKWQAKEQKR